MVILYHAVRIHLMFTIPLFPLQTVLFPGMPLHLHIFEPRYRTMVQACMEQNQPFGVVLIRRGEETFSEMAEPYPIGCTARIVDVEPLEQGCFNITTLGEDRFQILSLSTSEDAYLQAEVEFIPLEHPRTLYMLRAVRPLSAQMNSYLCSIAAMDAEWQDLCDLQLPQEPLHLAYLAASLLQIPAHEKQPLLAAKTANELFDQVNRLVRRENAILHHLGHTPHEEAQRASWLN